MTAAHDDRSIVRAQQSLASIAYSTASIRPLSKKQQRHRDAIVESISGDSVMAHALNMAEDASKSLHKISGASRIATLWELKAKERMVGTGAISSLIWMIAWNWVFPMLLEWAKAWLAEQMKNNVTVTISPMQGRTSDR